MVIHLKLTKVVCLADLRDYTAFAPIIQNILLPLGVMLCLFDKCPCGVLFTDEKAYYRLFFYDERPLKFRLFLEEL